MLMTQKKKIEEKECNRLDDQSADEKKSLSFCSEELNVWVERLQLLSTPTVLIYMISTWVGLG